MWYGLTTKGAGLRSFVDAKIGSSRIPVGILRREPLGASDLGWLSTCSVFDSILTCFLRFWKHGLRDDCSHGLLSLPWCLFPSLAGLSHRILVSFWALPPFFLIEGNVYFLIDSDAEFSARWLLEADGGEEVWLLSCSEPPGPSSVSPCVLGSLSAPTLKRGT